MILCPAARKVASGPFRYHALSVLCLLAVTAPTAMAQTAGGVEEGTFLDIDVTSGARIVNGNPEPVIKPNSRVQINIQPGNTHTVSTDAGGNFALNRRKLSKDEVNEISATFTVPVCLWQYRDPRARQTRRCFEATNQFTMRWRKFSNDGKVSGDITPSGSVILNTGRNRKTALATPYGSDTGNFEVPPIIGNYNDGNGTLETTVVNVVRDGLKKQLIDLAPYAVTMTVETKNTRGIETGLGIK